MLSNWMPSVGIIGGADGPTRVFVTGSWATGNWQKALTFGAAAALLVLGVIAVVIVKNRKQ